MTEGATSATLALLASALVFAPSAARAGLKLFTAQWYTESFGNECQGTLTPGGLPAPHCTVSTGEFASYSNWGIPAGFLCDRTEPRCPLESTPTDGSGNFHPLGGPGNPTMPTSINCTPLSQYGAGITLRPAKGQTAFPRIPPLYRNPVFFTVGGQPNRDACDQLSTGYTTQNRTRFGANKGKVQLGNPVAGSWNATTTGLGAFSFPAAPVNHKAGVRTGHGTRTTMFGRSYQGSARSGQVGEFNVQYPYVYSYTYATLRNDAGVFGTGEGPGSFNIKYTDDSATVASITVKQGPEKFGGTMKMLNALTTKVCYWLQVGGGACSPSYLNWLYDWVGVGAHKSGGVVTMGITVTWMTPPLGSCSDVVCDYLTVVGSRFPWMTGSVTVTAVGRGPHKTVHYARGYDNRTPTSGLGTIQLVSPLLTRWLGFVDFETGGIGVLRIQFIPEPHSWMVLVAGASLLVVGTRLRRR